MLELRGEAELVRVEQPLHRHLAAEQSIEGDLVDVEPHKLPRCLGMTISAPSDNDVVDGAPRFVVALARATVGGADGVSVSLRRCGRLGTVAASDQTISDMEASQYATDDGPASMSPSRDASSTLCLDTETPWPAFGPRARALGISAILSSPLLAADRPVGALNIYSRTARAFGPDAQDLASVFAAEASRVLTTAGVVVTDEQFSARLGEALKVRRVIAQAEGVIMERDGVEADQAYGVLCDRSRRSNQPFREHAAAIMASTQRPRLESGPESTDRHDG
jgi:hypothetical protein